MKNLLSTNSLVSLLKSYNQMSDAILQVSDLENSNITGLKGSLKSFFIAQYIEHSRLERIHKGQYEGKAPLPQDFLIVVSTAKEADEIESDLQTIIQEKVQIFKLSWWQTLPYRSVAKSSVIFGERASFLSKLADKSLSPNAKDRVFIVSERSFLSPLPPSKYVRNLSLKLKAGMSLDIMQLSSRLTELGFLRVPRVSVHGEYALRGEVIDVFMPGEKNAFRLLFDFDTLDQIKTFDIETQSSKEKVDEILIYPMKEVLWTEELVEKLESYFSFVDKNGIENDYASYDSLRHNVTKDTDLKPKIMPECLKNDTSLEGTLSKDELFESKNIYLKFTREAKEKEENLLMELSLNKESEGEEFFYGQLWGAKCSLLDYVQEDTPVFYVDFDRMVNAEKSIQNEYEISYRSARLNFPVPPPSELLLNFSELIESHKKNIQFRSLDNIEIKDSLNIQSEVSRSFFGNINYLKEELTNLQNSLWHIYVFADNPNQSLRIKEILKDFIEPEILKEKSSALGQILFPLQILPLSLSEGFSVTEEKILVIQENEIFGRKKNTPVSTRKVSSKALDSFIELNPGDYVVHVNYGIGLFKGIERVKTSGYSHGEKTEITERDYIKLEYADEEYAFVPIEQVNMVQRYIGNENEKPRLDRIGSKSWTARKAKVQAKVEEIANKLIDLYSKRQASRGFPFPKDTEWQAAFEAAFPYEDTPDQALATEDIKKDMESSVPMDRLVCGDVGYGKTEIAMRAAFKAVMGGKQVAFLAPTTILAEQHYENCLERFKNFPVSIAQMSRFVSTSEQRKILEKLKKGEVDILIGTHRIIQKDVIFKDLGLMIIDEEQRFGVKDKEKLKVLKNNIDSLAMSATPIPRTLHMSLLKIRDMSLLTTPPQNRQSIETSIESYDDEKIARAIRREVERGGQVFYLHNRVETLEETRIKLEHLLPEMLIDTAHGQMSAEELDDIFRRFKMGGFNVLVATTIIENGIDIPNVNTIIIDRADMYGVSQLYQLRGRVGRSDRKAYAYLFYPENKALSEVAMKRLQVISDFTELGSGFKIAMKDMEIRGAGNLLGRDQSGEVYAVGFEMYLNLLNQAIERLTTSGWHAQDEVLLELEYSGFIPDTYIKDAQTKMELYKKIASISSEDELTNVYGEFFDRFGPVPDEVNSLLSLAKIRIISNRLGIKSLKEKQGVLNVEFNSVNSVNIDKVLRLIKTSGGRVRLNPQNPNLLILQTGSIDLSSKADFIKEKLEALA